MAIDVELEILKLLEEQMFEVSKAAGRAGYWQWGRDAGDHQEDWDPYEHLPADWHHNDAEYDDDNYAADLEVSENVSASRFLFSVIFIGIAAEGA
jgi:hypothetical protein